MDAERFDTLSRFLAVAATRRRVFGILFGAAAAALVGISPRRAVADTADPVPTGVGTGFCGRACANPGDCEGDEHCYVCCAGFCVSLVNDPLNCGTCGNVCSGGQYAACDDA